jgi:glycosyltransferase involved in cell wall biosynthesis
MNLMEKLDTYSLRVLSVIPGERGGALMIFAKRQVASLRALGVENHEFYLSSRTDPVQIFKELRLLRLEIKRVRPHIVHAHYGTVTALLCALVAPVPLVITFRGSDLNPSLNVNFIRNLTSKLFSQLAALRARHIVCVTSQLREQLWWRRNCVTVLPTGIDMTEFYPRDRSTCRAQLGWGLTERVVVFNAGDNPRRKRLDLAQAAIDAARAMSGEIRFIVMQGKTPPELVPVMFSAADCLLLTSDLEGSPNVVKEALACNLPVVAVDVGDVKERLEGVFPSAIVPKDVTEISTRLVEILKTGERSNGRELVAVLSHNIVANRLISIYLNCLGIDAPKQFSDTI